MNELTYPYNLLYKVYETSYPTNLNNDQMEGFQAVMNKLSDYEYEVIVLRYKKGIKTYSEIETLIDGSTKNAYVAEVRALQKFKRPENIGLIFYGLQGFHEQHPFALETQALSTRTYQALIRSNIHSLTDIHSVEQLNRVRNLGNKSKEEVFKALQRHGFSITKQPFTSSDLLKNKRKQNAIDIAIRALQNHKNDDNYEEYTFAINELKKLNSMKIG